MTTRGPGDLVAGDAARRHVEVYAGEVPYPREQRSSTPSVTVTAEVTVDVTDAAALRQAALDSIDADTQVSEEERHEAREQVADDPAEAVTYLADPTAIVDGIPGIAPVNASWHSTLDSTNAPTEPDAIPDFAAIFPLTEHTTTAGSFTPRTTAILHHTLCLLADAAYDDADQHGDSEITDAADLLGRLPRLTWRQDLPWRRQFARAFDDLADDLAAGHWPTPRCAGEELALHLALIDAPAIHDLTEELGPILNDLPHHPSDHDWDTCRDALLQDHDVTFLYDYAHDGIEDPTGDTNRDLGIGDLRPHTWYRPFNNIDPRDPHRGFRR